MRAWVTSRLDVQHLFAGWPVSVSPASILAALVLATGVGVAFGVYPAQRAAAIQPIDARRRRESAHQGRRIRDGPSTKNRKPRIFV